MCHIVQLCHVESPTVNLYIKFNRAVYHVLSVSTAEKAEGLAAAPFPVCVIQVGDGAVRHGVDRLTQQPVFVLKHTDEPGDSLENYLRSSQCMTMFV